MDFLNFDDKTLLQMANELEFSQFQDLDDIILSQMPMLKTADLNIDNIDDLQFTGNFKLDFNCDDIAESETLATDAVLDVDSKEVNFPTGDRWSKPVNDSDIDELINNCKNKNTSKNTKWAFNVFTAWRETREETVPLLLDMDHEQLSFWLSRFICEARKQNSEPYPSKTLYLLMCGLLRYLRDNGVFDYNFMDPKDSRFARLNKVLDSRMKQLLEQGIDFETKSAEPLLPEDEDKLWNLGVFGNTSAENLQLSVFFYGCKFFGLRGYDEHRSLQSEQFTVGRDDRGKWIQFVGKTSKTNQGGLRSMKLDTKNIRHYCAEGPRCVADLFEQYLQAVGTGYFYKRPLSGSNGTVRYGNQPVGVNKIKTFMKTIAKKGGLSGNYTNHSGKKTCATVLYDQNVDEQEIMQRTGHRSTAAVRKYKRATPQVVERTSNALNPPEAKHQKTETTVLQDGKQSPESEKQSRNVLSDITNSLPQRCCFNNCTFNFSLNNHNNFVVKL